SRRFDQNVANVSTLRKTVLIFVLRVVLPHLGIGSRRDTELCRINNHVTRLAFLGIGIRVLRLVGIVVGLELGLGRLDVLEQLLGGENGVIELHLLMLLLEFLLNLRFRYVDSTLDESGQLAFSKVLLYKLFKLIDSHAEIVLDEPFIGVLPDKISIGKEGGSHRTALKIVTQLLVSDMQPETVGFANEGGVCDQTVSDARENEADKLRR